MALPTFQKETQEIRDRMLRQFPLSAKELRLALQKQHYFLDATTCRKLVNYLLIGKPVGLRGEPGVGKSELPERIANLIGARFLDIECHSQLEAMDIGVSWNAFKQIVDAQTGNLQGEPFSRSYLNRTPLLESLLSPNPVVIRVDEVDKLNESTSNFFLRYLDKQELVVHELAEENKTIRAQAPIYVFLTSNDYRPLDPAMMRRIAWIDLSFPSEEDLSKLIRTKTGVPEPMARRITYIAHRLRSLPLQKKPSIGEILDWTKGLILETDGRLSLDAIQVTLGLLLKYPDDERTGWEAIRSWVGDAQ